jgi:hypothetical protein
MACTDPSTASSRRPDQAGPNGVLSIHDSAITMDDDGLVTVHVPEGRIRVRELADVLDVAGVV